MSDLGKLLLLGSTEAVIHWIQPHGIVLISSDRSSCTDDGLLYIYPGHFFQIFTQFLDAIDVTSVTLKRLNSINADNVTRYLGDIFGIFWEYFGDILRIF